MWLVGLLLALSAAFQLASAAPPAMSRLATKMTGGSLQHQTACSKYLIINTRGTNEPQGESAGFRVINARIALHKPGGKVVNTVYPASPDQHSEAATRFIVRQVRVAFANDPSICIFLEGYSQGASATVNAMSILKGRPFEAVKGVLLVGNPKHRAGLACNVDNRGGKATLEVDGVEAGEGRASIPQKWVAKTLDICIRGDGVCDTKHSKQVLTRQHMQYPDDRSVHNLGVRFALEKLGKA